MTRLWIHNVFLGLSRNVELNELKILKMKIRNKYIILDKQYLVKIITIIKMAHK